LKIWNKSENKPEKTESAHRGFVQKEVAATLLLDRTPEFSPKRTL